MFLYCLLLVYSSIWIPWHRHVSATIPHWYAGNYIRLGYGWLWAGPRNGGPDALYATPDLALVVLRMIASTAVGAAAYFLTGTRSKP
jgi:hypothetical protein